MSCLRSISVPLTLFFFGAEPGSHGGFMGTGWLTFRGRSTAFRERGIAALFPLFRCRGKLAVPSPVFIFFLCTEAQRAPPLPFFVSPFFLQRLVSTPPCSRSVLPRDFGPRRVGPLSFYEFLCEILCPVSDVFPPLFRLRLFCPLFPADFPFPFSGVGRYWNDSVPPSGPFL